MAKNLGGPTLDSKLSVPWLLTASQMDSSHNNSEAKGITIPSLKIRELAFREIKESLLKIVVKALQRRDCLLSPPVSMVSLEQWCGPPLP